MMKTSADSTSASRIVASSALLLAILLAARSASPQAFELLHEFRGDLVSIRGGVTLAPDGSLYGTTYDGGAYGQGSVFVLHPDGAGSYLWESVHDFNGSDGAYPGASLLLVSDGNLYGTTELGGAGWGTIFRVDGGTGELTTLYSFVYADGANPSAGVMEGSDGLLYGTTNLGGSGGFQQGTIFQWDLSSDTLTTLHTFRGGVDGAVPVSSLVEAADGNFYGTTRDGGAHGDGTVFQVDRAGNVTLLHSFDGATEGSSPEGALAEGPDGLYGTTSAGGPTTWGTIFRIDASGGFTTVHVFDGADGGGPAAGLLLGADGNFYGTTRSPGTVFAISPSGTLRTIHAFSGADGARPQATLVQDADDNLYGSTSSTGHVDAAGNGTVFRIDPAGNLTTLHRFGSGAPANPRAGLIELDGDLYGTSSLGGTADYGSVYRVSPSGTMTEVSSFEGSDGAFPVAALVRATDGGLYGVAAEGGSSGWGTIFRVDSSGAIIVLHHFDLTNGGAPRARLIEASDGFLYGTTSAGGDFGQGTIFRISRSGAFTLLHSFDGGDGSAPMGLIEGIDGAFYGAAVFGGSDERGTVFRMEPSGDVTVIHSFSGADGSYPETNVIQAADGDLYGTTLQGGDNDQGTVFEIATSGGLTTLYHFTGGGDGAGPRAGLFQGSDGNLYGTTVGGGDFGAGTVFQMDTTGALTRLHSFDFWSNGGNPLGDLVQGSDGHLYGTAWRGAPFDRGAAFRLALGLSAPEAVASGSATICEDASTSLSGSGGVSCSWSPVLGLDDPSSCTPEASPESTTIYTLTVTDASGNISVNDPTVTVTVDCPDILTVSPAILDFGQVPLGKTKDLDLTITNNTATPVTLADTIVVEQRAPHPFDASAPGGCRGGRLDPGDFCVQTVRFWSVPEAELASPATLRFLEGNAFATLATVELRAATGPPDTGPNAPPVAEDDLAGVAPGFTHTLNALLNDSDPDNDLLRVVTLSEPPHGTAAVVSCGGVFPWNPNADCIEYVPDDGYLGLDAIAYTVSDGRGGTDTAIYHLAVGTVVPSITSIVPSSGPVTGGQAVRITGANFLYRSNVEFLCSGSVVLSLTVTDLTDTEILATTPPGFTGSCDLRVRTLFAQTGQLANAYTYVPGIEDVRTPVDGGPVSGEVVTVNAAPGSQTDPHVSEDWMSYTDQASVSAIRYYDFVTGLDAAIPSEASIGDLLSDVDAGRITFGRVLTDRVVVMLFDASTQQLTEVDPQPGSFRFFTAIGGDTVAFSEGAFGLNDIFAWSLATSTGENVSASPMQEESPSVSPDGNAIVWERDTGGGDVFKALRENGSWVVSPVADTLELEESPDTDGTWVVYDADRAGSPTGQDTYFKPLAGGPETRLAIPGTQRNPSISRGVLSFESQGPGEQNSDIVVYVISTNTAYQVTSTPLVNDVLSDVSVLPNGDVRVVWAGCAEYFDNCDVFALTFTPTPPPGATTTTLSSSANPSTSGQEVTFTATVTSGSGVPTGTVTLYDGSNELGTTALDASSHATFTTSSLAVGTHVMTAVYSGDLTYFGSISTALSQVVEVPLPIVLVVHETITVADAPTLTPSVMLTVPETITVTDAPTLTPSVMLMVPETITVTDLPELTVIATTVTLASGPNPSVAGDLVTITVTATSPLGVPSGDVALSYRVPGVPVPIVLGTVALDGAGTATLTTSELRVGNLTVAASYLGNPVFAPASAFLLHTVAPAPTTTSLVSSGLSFTTRPPIFTATVGSSAPWPATGTVQFFADGGSIGRSPVFERGGVRIAVMGGATLGVGTHEITARYSGDASYLGSDSGPLSQTAIPGDYVTVDLTPAFTDPTEATAVNGADQVVGYSAAVISGTGLVRNVGFIYSGGLGPLGSLGGTSTVPLAINEAGQVAGRSTVAPNSNAAHAFLYQSGQMTDLGTLAGGTSQALAINDAGQVVGIADTGSGVHAFLYQSGTLADLGTLGGPESAALAINSSGFAAGISDLADGSRHAAYYTYPWLDLGTLGGTSSRAVAINDAGQVAGTSELAGDLDAHAFVWQGGGLIDIAGAGGPSSTAFAINDAGQIVGWTFDPLVWGSHNAPPDPLNAFFYSSGQLTELGTLAGGTSKAVDISNAGLVVGVSDDHAFVSAGGALRDLGTLGGLTSRASAISDRGLIVGSADTVSGLRHAVAWVPVPVPTLVVTPATGAVGGTTTLSATLTLFGLPLPNQAIAFTLNGAAVGSASTDAMGVATLAGVTLAGLATGTYPSVVGASYGGVGVVVGATEAMGDLTITPFVDHPPVAADDVYLIGPDPLSIPAPGVLENDADPDGDTLTAELVSGPTHGILAFAADGSFTYAPAPGSPVDDLFTYRAIGAGVASNVATVSLPIQPIFGGLVTPPRISINAGPGDQNDPHVDGDLISYTNLLGTASDVRYYDFGTTLDAAIPRALGYFDFLSDVSGGRISFSRIFTDRVAAMVFDSGAQPPQPIEIEIDPHPGTSRFGTTIGGNVVAFTDGLSGNRDVFAWDLGSSTGTNVSGSPEPDQNPSLSRDGTVLVWERRGGQTLLDVWMARRAGGSWAVSTVADTPGDEGNADTDGTWVVYEADRPTGRHIYLRPVAGGSEIGLPLPGAQLNASIHRGVISFESTSPAAGAKSDLFVYVIATNILYQVTDTPTLGEHLNDVTVLPNGDIRVVWAADDGPTSEFDHDIYAVTFTPGGASAPPIAVASGSSTICEGASTALSGTGGVSCSWAPATGLDDAASCAPVASPTVTTIYTLTVTDASGTASTNGPAVAVTVEGLPTATASGSATIAAGQSTPLTGSGGVSCAWSPAAGLDDAFSCTPSASPHVTTAYALTVTSSGSCRSTNPASATITVVDQTPPTAVLDAPATIGFGTQLVLSGERSFDVGGVIESYTWFLVDEGTTVVTQAPTFALPMDPTHPLGIGPHEFRLTVTDDSGNVSSPAVATVTVVDQTPPTAVLDAPSTIGFGTQLVLSGERSFDVGGVIESYTWFLVDEGTTVVTQAPTFALPMDPTHPLGIGPHEFRLTVTDDSGNVSSPAVATVTVTSSTRTLTVTTVGVGAGTVTSVPSGIACGTSCSAPFAHGSVVTLVGTAGSGSAFGGWSGDPDCADGVVTMDADVLCTAGFNRSPDLVVSALDAPSPVAAGATFTVTDTTRNRAANGGPAYPGLSTTRLYLSADKVLDPGDTLLAGRPVPQLGPGASDSGATNVTLPTGASGVLFIIAQADGDDTVPETNEGNNTRAQQIRVGADLGISALSVPARSGPGEEILVTETTRNAANAGPAGATRTGFYLSSDAALDAADTLLGSRPVGALAAGGSEDATTSVTLPTGVGPGAWYVIAKADYDEASAELNEANNTRARPITLGPPDLLLSALSAPGRTRPGASIDVTDTVRNVGNGAAGPSVTEVYLSADAVLDPGDVLLASRSVGALGSGQNSQGATTIVIPASAAPGSYFLIAAADATGAVNEGDEANNLRSRALVLR